jgi:hypothetical protein
VIAPDDRLEGDLLGDAREDLGERDLGADGDVASGRRRRGAAAPAAEEVVEGGAPSPAAAAEDRVEDVPEAARAGRLGVEPARAQALVAEGVVGTPALGVGEHLVGLRGRLELLLGVGIVAIDVRVELAGELAERLLDLAFVRPPVDAEGLVVVVCH